jgi:hypothetical protein
VLTVDQVFHGLGAGIPRHADGMPGVVLQIAGINLEGDVVILGREVGLDEVGVDNDQFARAVTLWRAGTRYCDNEPIALP